MVRLVNMFDPNRAALGVAQRWSYALNNAEALPDSDPDKRVAMEALEAIAVEWICGFESGDLCPVDGAVF